MKAALKILVSAFLVFLPFAASARKFSISTDILGYAQLGTMNVDASYAINRRLSLVAGARYNPFTFRQGDSQKQFQYRQQSYSFGLRLWPWHIWSGWWFAGKIRYQEYNKGGLISLKTEEGDRFGAGLYSGYTHMLSSHFNLEFGVGLWAGYDRFRAYSCPACGERLSQGNRFFLLPDDFMIAIVYVF